MPMTASPDGLLKIVTCWQDLVRSALFPQDGLEPTDHEIPIPFTDWSRAQLLTLRKSLYDGDMSYLARAEIWALLGQTAKLSEILGGSYGERALLDGASRFNMQAAIELLKSLLLPRGDRVAELFQRVEELELFSEEAECLGASFSGFVAELLLEKAAGAQLWRKRRLRNRLRAARLEGQLPDRWLADGMLWSIAKREVSGLLIWTVGLPLAVTEVSEFVEVDATVRFADVEARGGPKLRREQVVQRVAGRLGKQRRVACIGNHSTVESRKALLRAGRKAGVASVCVYFDCSDNEIERRLEASDWSIRSRAIDYAKIVLDPPRPHEAEVVLVVGDSGLKSVWIPDDAPCGGFFEAGDYTPASVDRLMEEL